MSDGIKVGRRELQKAKGKVTVEMRRMAEEIAARVVTMSPEEIEREVEELAASLPMMLDSVAEVLVTAAPTDILDVYLDAGGLR